MPEDAPTLAQAQRDEHDMSIDPYTYSGALTQAIFAINTLLHPDASDDAEVDRMEADAEQIIERLIELRKLVHQITHPITTRWSA